MIQAGNSLEYFAATDDPIKLADGMLNKIRAYREWCASRGLMSLWEKKLRNYYGRAIAGNSSQSVVAGGSEGELMLIKVNDLHNLVQNQLVIVTAQRPAGIARAINSDSKSLKASRIGSAIAEYYMAQQGYETKFVACTEAALLCDEAFIDLTWDKSAGDPIAVDPETGEPEMSGDVVLSTHCAWNAARDTSLNIEHQKWYIFSYRMNKFDAAAEYPKFAQEIIACKDDNLPSVPMNSIDDESDAVWCHRLVHDRTASVKEGRYSVLIGDRIVFDSVLPYRDFPVCRISPSDVIEGSCGYSSANDILALEEVTDSLYSIITTNEVSFGGNNIIAAEGMNIKHSDLAKGLRFFEVDPALFDKIKVLELVKTAPECFNFINMLNAKKEQQVGVNSVTRGQPEGQLAGASGSALALVQTQSIAFNSGIQRSYFKLLSDTMTKLIGILRVYADTPRVARIVGKSKASGLKEFKYTGSDLNSISSIVYELVNPVSQTYGGRLEMAKDLLGANQIKSPKQYINLVQTGQLDVLTEDDEADGMLILEENEWLNEGRPFKAVITQIHADHIKSHTSQITLDLQETDPEAVARILAHIQDHINLWQQASLTNPGILMATGQHPLMPPPPPGLPPAIPGPVPPQGGPPLPPQPQVQHEGQGGPNLGKLLSSGPPVLKKASEVKQPRLPNIAGTQTKPTIPGVIPA